MSKIFYSPVSPLVLIILILLVIIGIPLLFFGLIGAALANLGFGFWGIVALIIAIIVGSFINLPVTTLHQRKPKTHARKEREPREPKKPRGQYAPSMYDKMYRTERFEVYDSAESTNYSNNGNENDGSNDNGFSRWFGSGFGHGSSSSQTGMKVCINVGGALIPLLIALYLIVSAATGHITTDPWYLVKMAAAVAIVSLVSFLTAKPVRGIGIAAPFFAAPIAALALGLILGGGFGLPAAGVAFVSGTLGTVIGADILHMRDIQSYGTKMVSIGGAGTFDGILLTGIVAALLSSF